MSNKSVNLSRHQSTKTPEPPKHIQHTDSIKRTSSMGHIVIKSSAFKRQSEAVLDLNSDSEPEESLDSSERRHRQEMQEMRSMDSDEEEKSEAPPKKPWLEEDELHELDIKICNQGN